MADENNENDTNDNNQASTSKNEAERASGHDIYYYNDRRNDKGSNSETSVSATYSVRSGLDTVDAQPAMPNPTTVKKERESNAHVKRKPRRRIGRIEKRTERRHRRAPRRKPRVMTEKKGRDLSVSTILSRLSSRGDARDLACMYCGHRCCRRRYYEERIFRKKAFRSKKIISRRYHRKKNYISRLKKISRAKDRQKNRLIKERRTKIAELIQVGSRSPMFSPLFVNNSIVPNTEEIVEENRTYSEVTPQMIYETLRKLTAWRQNVVTADILEYMRRNYPVNPERTELYKELKEKLRIASLVGIVIEVSEDYWCLKSPHHMRNLSVNHVTLFWKVYGDTLSAIKRQKRDVSVTEKTDEQTNTALLKNKADSCYDIV